MKRKVERLSLIYRAQRSRVHNRLAESEQNRDKATIDTSPIRTAEKMPAESRIEADEGIASLAGRASDGLLRNDLSIHRIGGIRG